MFSKTRWNSVCDMFERLMEQRWAVTAVLSDRTVTKIQNARTLDERRTLAANGRLLTSVEGT